MEFKTIAVAAKEALEYVEGVRSGKIKFLRSKFSKMDKAMSKLQWGDILLIAGMSGSGKTLFTEEYITSLIELNPNEKFDVINFNYEMAAKRLAIRKLASKMRISMADLLNDEVPILSNSEMVEIAKFLSNELSKYPIYYAEFPHTIKEMEDRLYRHWEANKRPMIVEIDHIGLTKQSASEAGITDMIYKLGNVESTLKKNIPICFINVSQLNRDIETVARKAPGSYLNFPQKSDISWGDGLYHHADYVLINHRPSMLKLDIYGKQKYPVEDNDIYHHIIKSRTSETVVIKYFANFKNMRLEEKIDEII